MSVRQVLLVVAIVGAFGVLVPYYKGSGFLDRRLIIAYGCLGAVIAGPTASDAFTRDEPGGAIGKLVRAWLISWLFAAWLLALAIITVNLTTRHDRLLLPRAAFLAAVGCFSITAAAAAATLGATLTRKLSAPNIKATFRVLFLVLIAVFFLVDRFATVSLTTAALTRLLWVLSGVFGAAALVLAARYPDR